MMKLQWTSVVNSLSVLLMLGSTSFAGVILNSPAPVASGPGLGLASVSLISTLSPNNDNSPVPNPNDNNITVPIKRFDNVGFIDLVFAVAASSGVSEYKVSEFVDNNTGSPWTSYHMQLGFGTGANFQLSALNDGLDFDFPDYDTPPASTAFPFVATPDEDQLVYTGGIHGAGAKHTHSGSMCRIFRGGRSRPSRCGSSQSRCRNQLCLLCLALWCWAEWQRGVADKNDELS